MVKLLDLFRNRRKLFIPKLYVMRAGVIQLGNCRQTPVSLEHDIYFLISLSLETIILNSYEIPYVFDHVHDKIFLPQEFHQNILTTKKKSLTPPRY